MSIFSSQASAVNAWDPKSRVYQHPLCLSSVRKKKESSIHFISARFLDLNHQRSYRENDLHQKRLTETLPRDQERQQCKAVGLASSNQEDAFLEPGGQKAGYVEKAVSCFFVKEPF